MSEEPQSLLELRVLDGANIYFPRPAVKLTLDARRLLALDPDMATSVAERLGVPGSPRPGPLGSMQRDRFAARVLAHLARRIATAARVRLAARGRVGAEPGEVVVAFPWRRLTKAEALGNEIARVLDAIDSPDLDALIAAAGARVAATPPGAAPDVPVPAIPTVAVTGTNGKTTVTRLIAHIGRSAGLRVGWNNTDGIYLDGELVEEGDWSGYGGAGRVLAEPGLGLAVLETARGGVLLRGIGAAHNDVAVVTNVSADHLGLQGIHTLDQLAEVKAAIIRITKPTGWVVLNADDPRVLAMRRHTKARPYAFSLDPDSPGLRAVLDERGRGITVLDGDMVLLHGGDPDHLVPIDEVPVTLAGLSSHNVANALAAAAAALSVGLPRAAVVEGLRTFLPDASLNPGRMNVWSLRDRIVIVDLAHNEESLRALLEVARGLRQPGGAVWCVLGTAGDRTDALLRALGEIAAKGADRAVIAEKEVYLRGRDPAEMITLFRAGAGAELPAYATELDALAQVVGESSPGDVVALMCHAQRAEVDAWLAELGGAPVDSDGIRALARR